MDHFIRCLSQAFPVFSHFFYAHQETDKSCSLICHKSTQFDEWSFGASLFYSKLFQISLENWIMAWLCFSLCRYILSCKYTRDTHIVKTGHFNLLKIFATLFSLPRLYAIRNKTFGVLNVATLASYTSIFRVAFCLCMTPVSGLVLQIKKNITRCTTERMWLMIESLMTSRLCKRRIFGVFLDAIEKKNSHKWKDIHHTLNPSSERYIKPRREHLCGKYIENHQKNYREGRYTIEIVEPSSLTPLPDLFFVAKTKIKLYSDFCACSSFIAECRYQFEVDSLKNKVSLTGNLFLRNKLW